MSEIIGICVGVLVVVSLIAIVAYLLAFVAVMVWVSLKPSKCDPIDSEFEELLRDFQSRDRLGLGGGA
jgi:hypothetical protein